MATVSSSTTTSALLALATAAASATSSEHDTADEGFASPHTPSATVALPVLVGGWAVATQSDAEGMATLDGLVSSG